jgi:aminoacrylate peracid reductase
LVQGISACAAHFDAQLASMKKSERQRVRVGCELLYATFVACLNERRGEKLMSKTVIIPANSAPPLAPYSPGVKAGNAVYVSGMLALDSDGKVVGAGDIRAQTRAVIDAIKAVVEAAGGTLGDIAFNSIFLKNMNDYAAMNDVYGEYFSHEAPARYCIRSDLVRPEFLIEISSIAYVGS